MGMPQTWGRELYGCSRHRRRLDVCEHHRTGFIPTGGASRLVNSSAKFHLGIINGGASSGTRYGYFSDLANYQHSTYTSDNQLCAEKWPNCRLAHQRSQLQLERSQWFY